MYSRWQEVFDISKLTFVDHEEYVRLETEHGESLRISTNVDRMEAELLKQAPEDAAEICRLAVRSPAVLPAIGRGAWLAPDTQATRCAISSRRGFSAYSCHA